MSDDDLELVCAEIARCVMGWTASEIPWAYDGATSVWHSTDGKPIMTVFSWRPDRNDTQNMQVLDRMIALGFKLTLTACGERAVVQFSLGSRPAACTDHRDRRVALLRAALAATRSAVE